MIASLQFADVGRAQAARLLALPPRPGEHGLRHAAVGVAVPLSGKLLPSPSLRRVGLLAFWEDDEAAQSFLERSPIGEALAGGWRSRLEPLRVWGSWPGVPAELQRARHTAYQGPTVVVTLGRLRLSQTARFLRASSRAEAEVLDAPGLVWATGLARPPFVCTCSLWRSVADMSAYAYDHDGAAHPAAIAEDRAKPFHRQSAFIRFRPYEITGSLAGRSPLRAGALP